MLLFLAEYRGLHLFVLVLAGAYRWGNENAIFYQLRFYQPNIPKTMHVNWTVSICYQRNTIKAEKHQSLMSDLTFTVFTLACQAVLTSASSSTNWTCPLNFILSVKIPKVVSTNKLENLYFDPQYKRCRQQMSYW